MPYTEKTSAQLRQIFAEQVTQNQSARRNHAHGEDYRRGRLPDAVVSAKNTQDVQKTMSFCHQHKIPLIAFGAGSSLEGHVVPTAGGLSLDLSQMNRILEVAAENMTARVEAGVTRRQLNRHLADTGLFFSVDPGAEATLGGMAATGASGTNTVRYGTIRDNVRSLQAVIMPGDIIETATQARKSSAGYNLTQLLIGSEGTLGVITELLVKLHGVPEAVEAMWCQFADHHQAIAAVIEIVHHQLPMARIEFADAAQMTAFGSHFDRKDFAPQTTLMLELAGSAVEVAAQKQQLQEIVDAHGACNCRVMQNADERNALWQMRHHAFYAARSHFQGSAVLVTDSCVPIAALGEALGAVDEAIAASGLDAPIVGHVGDGNFHCQILFDAEDSDAQNRARQLCGIISDIAIAKGGSCTGEHGIGLGKKQYLKKQHPDLLPLMRKIKQMFDPDNLLNPGKILD